MATKKRPPNLTLGIPTVSVNNVELEPSPANSSPYSSSPSSSISDSPITLPASVDTDVDDAGDAASASATSDDLSREMEALEQLRLNIKQNLRQRPIARKPSARQLSAGFSPARSADWVDTTVNVIDSPVSTTSSIYYTPVSETPASSNSSQFLAPQRTSSPPQDTYYDDGDSLQAKTLLSRLSAPRRPLVLDCCKEPSRLRHAVHIQIPPLILKRARKPAFGFASLTVLRQYAATDTDKAVWDATMLDASSDGTVVSWDGDVVVFDEDMDERQRPGEDGATAAATTTAWILVGLIPPLLAPHAKVQYLQGGLNALKSEPVCKDFLSTSLPHPQASPSGLFKLNTGSSPGRPSGGGGNGNSHARTLPSIEISPSPARSPLPVMPGNAIVDYSPSPPPSQISFRRPPPPRRPSVPSLKKLDIMHAPPTRSARSATLPLPRIITTGDPSSSSMLSISTPVSPRQFAYPSSLSSPSSSSSSALSSPSSSSAATMRSTASTAGPPSPTTPLPPPSPMTARPPLGDEEGDTPQLAGFTISTILPSFLFLGPEPTTTEHVQSLQGLGVRRILNMAIECNENEHGLALKSRFERYLRIPLRDTVEEERILEASKEACAFLDDARLHSAPTYVHCKAGKSRSVTAVLAYLIHAHHWQLSRAYAFVLSRRAGISPNIGFVSELMAFEELELGGGRSEPPDDSGGDEGGAGGGAAGGGGAGAGAGGGGGAARTKMRESLPPTLSHHHHHSHHPHPQAEPMSAVEDGTRDHNARMVEVGQEMEIRDAEGRYRHARRVPVDENTLQPMRRVSKAGLESANGSMTMELV